MHSYLDELNSKDIVYIDSFVSARECRLILEELEFVYWQASGVIKLGGPNRYEYMVGISRTSLTAHQKCFTDELNSKLANIESRLCEELNTKSVNFEEWQATR